MAHYQAKITTTFSDPRAAGRFAAQCHEHGYVGERAGGAVVTIIVHSHGDEAVVLGLAEEFGGHAEVEVLSDDE